VNKETRAFIQEQRSINQKEIRAEKMPFATVNLHQNFLCGAECSVVLFDGRPNAGGDVGVNGQRQHPARLDIRLGPASK
jgi:hypothetical protein